MLIGLHGVKGSGKSTVADYLESHYGFTRVRFADPLKNMMRALGLRTEHIEGNLKEVPCPLLGGQTPRYAMQTLGTEWGRTLIDEDLWVNAATNKVRSLLAWNRDVVMEDARFPNELRAIKALGGRIALIAPGDRLPISTDPHASEVVHMDLVDLAIPNDTTPDDLFQFIDKYIGPDALNERYKRT